MTDYKQAIWLSNVNTLVGSLCIASFALGAGLIIWNAAFGANPLEMMLLSTVYQR